MQSKEKTQHYFGLFFIPSTYGWHIGSTRIDIVVAKINPRHTATERFATARSTITKLCVRFSGTDGKIFNTLQHLKKSEHCGKSGINCEGWRGSTKKMGKHILTIVELPPRSSRARPPVAYAKVTKMIFWRNCFMASIGVAMQ